MYNSYYNNSAKPLTVTEAAQLTGDALKNLGVQRIIGEISGFRPSQYTNAFFDLKDGESIIKAAVFGRSNPQTFKQVQNGLKVIATGRFTMYAKTGSCNFIVNSFELAGIGELQMQIERRKSYYNSLGWFDPSTKKPLPAVINRIGIVTSASGAVFHDILDVTRRRGPDIDILLYPSPVQGEGAEKVIAQRIRQANRENVVDVLIVGRGGGSLEDLAPYSTDDVIQAIHESHLPIISAVGHEVDWPLSDYVADVRAGTPSIAAEKVTEKTAKDKERYHVVAEALRMNFHQHLAMADQNLFRLKISADSIIGRVDHLSMALSTLGSLKEPMETKMMNASWVLDTNQRNLNGALTNQMQEAERFIEKEKTSLKYEMRTLMESISSKAKIAEHELQALSPLAVLNRGFAVVSSKRTGHILKDTKDADIGDMVTIRMKDGSMEAVINDRR